MKRKSEATFIPKCRKKYGLTQQDLADKVGVSKTTIYTIENGRSLPKIKLALKIALVLKTDVEYLFKVVKNVF
ncbi:MAG: helix-turn-helix transcriptional regulator [Candidatus Scalindua sp.]|nr:helix-turn-helix transcriptional regulator [Candidatus Scalindua sp.]